MFLLCPTRFPVTQPWFSYLIPNVRHSDGCIRGPVRKRTIKHAKQFCSLHRAPFSGRNVLLDT
jgi:hypothetical protein